MLPSKLLATTCTVMLTTVDDAVWLVPHVASRRLSLLVRFLHGALFLTTLSGLSILSWAIAGLAQVAAYQWTLSGESTDDPERTTERLLSVLGAGLCWLIAVVLFARKWLKQRRRQQASQGRRADGDVQDLLCQQSLTTEPQHHSSYGSNVPQQQSEVSEQHGSEEGTFSPLNVIALTTLGALDELSYFPTLLMGHIVSPLELCGGTLLAAFLILLIVTCCLAHFQPLVDFLDRIPLYGIVALFAILLTVRAIVEWR